MGRQPWSDRQTVEDCRTLNIASLVSSGLFHYPSPQSATFASRGLEITVTSLAPEVIPDEWIWNGNVHVKAPAIGSRLRFSFRLGAFGSEVEQEVDILSAPSRLRRGKRFYFRCPGRDEPCGRRVGKLYLPPGEASFACRHCWDLTYESCKAHQKRLDKFRQLPPQDLALALGNPDPTTRLLALNAVIHRLGG
jgi:hypothetical protein